MHNLATKVHIIAIELGKMIKIERWNFRRTLKVFTIILLFFNLRYGFGTRTHLGLDGFDLKDTLFWVLQFNSFAHRGRSKI